MNPEIRGKLDEVARLTEILCANQGSGLASTVNTIVVSLRLDRLIEELKKLSETTS